MGISPRWKSRLVFVPGANYKTEMFPHPMKKITLVSTLALLALFIPAVNTAFAEEDSPLSERMEAMSHNLKAIQKQVADPAKKDATLVLVDKMKKNAVAASGYLPSMTKGIPAKDLPQFKKDYKLAMDELIEQIGTLGKAVRDGKLTDAQTIIKDILESKREGHADFINKKGKGGEEDDDE
jgi:soluble cytochrome b562